MSWHVGDPDLAAYADGSLPAPGVWSVEAHLAACEGCRERLTFDAVDAGWERLDAELDAPRPGLVERALSFGGVPATTARLLTATPALRGSWLVSVTLTLLLAAVLAHYAQPLVFLALTPLLPVLGVAVSFGPGIDPTHEVTVVAPYSTFRLLLLRCATVLAANTLLTAAASLALAEYGVRIAGWFLPSLALTILTLLITPRLGAVPAATVVGLGWLSLVLGTRHSTSLLPYTAAGQVAMAVAAALAAVALGFQMSAFDRTRPLPRRFR
ncbi:anti-sigma factor family protein [Cryptosporangium japonicum]|uniref:Putative zinc-finger domain-containing protein n=1 Tax=Cryptosporangium japonicum TaxID=80872 RepID=A0ABN0U449_9ACTN